MWNGISFTYEKNVSRYVKRLEAKQLFRIERIGFKPTLGDSSNCASNFYMACRFNAPPDLHKALMGVDGSILVTGEGMAGVTDFMEYPPLTLFKPIEVVMALQQSDNTSLLRTRLHLAYSFLAPDFSILAHQTTMTIHHGEQFQDFEALYCQMFGFVAT
jgi:hypothetical protein